MIIDKKKIIYILIALSVLLISNNYANDIQTLSEKLATYDQALDEANQRIEQLERKDHSQNQALEENKIEIHRLQSLVEGLENVTKEMAFIHGVEEVNGILNLTIDHAEWFSGDEANKAASEDNKDTSLPNGYYIRNNNYEPVVVEVDEDTLIYVLKGSNLEYMEYDKFKRYIDSPETKLFWYYEVENKVVLMMEQYRP